LRRTLGFLFCEFVLIAGISQICGYALKREGYIVNFDIITMLTPSGLFNNLVLGANQNLHSFYFRISERAGILQQPLLAGLIAVTVALAGLWLAGERRR
jgi:hypothetical protein